MPESLQNKLFYGDNLEILRDYIDDETIDLIYLDPPFNSNQDYNVLFAEKNGSVSQSQIKAFEDTWKWGLEAEEAYQETVEQGGDLSKTIRAYRDFLGENDMMAYLTMMALRLKELHRVLKQTGSIYLHCDPAASHYLKIIMDAIFGPDKFRTEIIWKRSSAHSDTKQGRAQHGRIHDVIFFYTKSDEWKWNPIYTPYDDRYIESFYKYTEPETGRRYRLGDLTGPGGAAKGNPFYEVMGVTRYWRYSKERMDQLIKEGRIVQIKPGGVPSYKRYLDEMPGVSLQDIWTDIYPISSQAAERLGYPTQKPESLLERIISASSDEGDTILDPFCGCGTTISVAQKLGRNWIGIDITHLAIALIKNRMYSSFGDQVGFEVIGEPISLADAEALAKQDPYQFQWWALGLLGARPVEQKKGADKGIDGRIIFFEHKGQSKPQHIIFSVKSGNITVSQIRDLRGVLDREKAAIGVFITLQKPTQPMIKEASSAGFYSFSGIKSENYPKIQIITVEELLEGRSMKCPPYVHAGGNITHKQAQQFQLPKGRKSKQMRIT